MESSYEILKKGSAFSRGQNRYYLFLDIVLFIVFDLVHCTINRTFLAR